VYYRKFRLWLSLRRRKGVHKRVYRKIYYFEDIFKLRVNKRIPFIGYFGAPKDSAKTVIVVMSGSHGLETLAIDIHLEFLYGFDQQDLINNNICLISIPIMNKWGFENGARTNIDGVDYLRSTPFVSRHPKKPLLLSGWKNKFFWCFTRLIGFSYYFQGFKMPKAIKELYRELLPIIKNGKNIIFYDLHTGNNDIRTTLWPHELDTNSVTLKSQEVYANDNILFENLPYGTDGAIIEYFVQKFATGNKKIAEISGYTIEFSVLEKAGPLHYVSQAIFGDVFDPPLYLRNQKMNNGLQQFSTIIGIPLKNNILG